MTIEAKLRVPFWWPLLLAFGGWLIGSLLKILSDLFGTATVTTADNNKSLGAWLTAGGGPMLAGGLVGAVAAWAAGYFPNETWGGSPSEWLKLAGAAVGASVAGSTFADLVNGLNS